MSIYTKFLFLNYQSKLFMLINLYSEVHSLVSSHHLHHHHMLSSYHHNEDALQFISWLASINREDDRRWKMVDRRTNPHFGRLLRFIRQHFCKEKNLCKEKKPLQRKKNLRREKNLFKVCPKYSFPWYWAPIKLILQPVVFLPSINVLSKYGCRGF